MATEVLPPEVAKYIERRELCEHFRGEPWAAGASADDRERRAFIATQLARRPSYNVSASTRFTSTEGAKQ